MYGQNVATFFVPSEHISGCPQKYHIIRTSIADDYFTLFAPERTISYLYCTFQQVSKVINYSLRACGNIGNSSIASMIKDSVLIFL